MMSVISKLKKSSKRAENKELVKHSFLSFIARIGGSVAAFFMNVILARYLGATEAGYVFLGIAVSTLLATFGRIGADTTVLRFVSVHAQEKNWPKVKAVVYTMLKWSYIPVLIVTLVMCLFAKPIAVYLFKKPEFTWPLFWISLSMPLFAGYNIYSLALQGIRKAFLSVIGIKVLTPLFLMIFFFILSPHDSVSGSIYYSIACLLNLIICFYWWSKSIPAAEIDKNYNTKVLWESSKHLWLIASMNQLVVWGGQFIAGIYNTPQEVAQLAVARTTSSLITFILAAVNNVSAPRFASMYAEGKLKELAKYARNTTWLMTLFALPITLILCIFPEFVMSFFGKDFHGGKWYLIILSIGQFINVSTGSVAYLLAMSGHEKQLKNVRIVSGIMAVVLAFILNPLYGAIGSAIASSIALASSNLLALHLVKKYLGFNTIGILGLKIK